MTRSKNRKAKGPRKEELEEKSFAIQNSSIFGRFLEANKDLKAGELILSEDPIVVGPSQDSEPLCIGCYKPFDYNSSCRCNECGFPLCSKTCPGKATKTGHIQDCSIISKSLIKSIPIEKISSNLEAITPLRCLALRQTQPIFWEKICEMESHSATRRNIKTLWTTNQTKVVEVIRNDWGLKEFDEEIIHQMCGVLEVNAFEVGPGLRGIYPTAYLFAHNCVPNTKHSDSPNFKIFFRTMVPVKKKTALFVTYTYILQGTIKRRKHLKDTKFFECKCERCKDSTEFSTNLSALRCPMCLDESVLCINPLDPDANWTCVSKNCSGYVIPVKNVTSLIDKLYLELDSINGNDIKEYENFLKKNSRILPENHYLNLAAQHCLYQLYGKIENYLINSLSDEQLQRKVDLCRNLLNAFSKLEPGLSKQRGIILYELHAPLMIQLQHWHQEKKHGKLLLKKLLNEVFKSLEESKLILETEPKESLEFQISEAAASALENLATWKSVICQS